MMKRIPKESIDWLREHHLRKERGKMEWRIAYQGKDEASQKRGITFYCLVVAMCQEGAFNFQAKLYVAMPPKNRPCSASQNTKEPASKHTGDSLGFSKWCATAREAVMDLILRRGMEIDDIFSLDDSKKLRFYPDFFDLFNFENQLIN